MTYGEIRFRIVKQAPGVDPDLIDGWIQDRYTEILDRLPWSRRRIETVLVTTAPVTAGTVAVTAGSPNVTLTGGTWLSTFSGRSFRVAGRDEYYQFTYASPTTATLDRAYEGETAAEAAYEIYQSVYALDEGVRLVEQIRRFDGPPLIRKSARELNEMNPGRTATGTPQYWAPYMSEDDPPRLQVELYPYPYEARALPLSYVEEAEALNSTSVTILPWIRPAALIAGVLADVKRHSEQWQAAREQEARFDALVTQMMLNDLRQKGATEIRMPAAYTRHRIERWTG